MEATIIHLGEDRGGQCLSHIPLLLVGLERAVDPGKLCLQGLDLRLSKVGLQHGLIPGLVVHGGSQEPLRALVELVLLLYLCIECGSAGLQLGTKCPHISNGALCVCVCVCVCVCGWGGGGGGGGGKVGGSEGLIHMTDRHQLSTHIQCLLYLSITPTYIPTVAHVLYIMHGGPAVNCGRL